MARTEDGKDPEGTDEGDDPREKGSEHGVEDVGNPSDPENPTG